MPLASVYEFERKLLPVCMELTRRGLRIDDAERRRRIEALRARASPLQEEAQEVVKELKEKLKQPGLMWKLKTCKGCRNGSKKKLSCEVCGGAGKREVFDFNLGSEKQLKDVLYNGLKLPVRYRDKKPTCDEEALQSLLALDKSGFVQKALQYAKLSTMEEIYERLHPAADGKVRTVFNPAGTLTGRLSSRGAFYVDGSTNLQNLPSFEASRDPLYEVRGCVVPPSGFVFLYADLSQAEARVSACLAEDEELLEKWKDPTWDIHRWTAEVCLGKLTGDAGGVTKTERFLYKTARHALNYGMGSVRYWREVNAKADLTGVSISLAEARRIHEQYHKLHPKLRKWWARVESEVRSGGRIRTCFGREANFWPRIDFEGKLDSDTLGAAIAYEPQSVVADLLNRGLLRVYAAERFLSGEGKASFRVVHQIHDAVLVEAREDAYMDVAKLLKKELEEEIEVRGYKLTIPVEVLLCRENWGKQERIL